MPKLPDLNRRTLLKGAAAGLAAGAIGAPAGALAAAPRKIKIGLIGTKTGAHAVFYEGMPYVLDLIQKELGPTIDVAGTKHPYEIIFRDSQSNPNQASNVAQELIFNEKVDLMLAWSGPSTVHPVSDQCEANGTPCITTVDPLDDYFIGRGAPKSGFQWTYNFFWNGAECTTAMVGAWNRIGTNKVVGGLWPNNAAGEAHSKEDPPVLRKAGYTVIDPGRFDLPSNYTAQITRFKEAKVEIVYGILPPPEFTKFWNAAAQQGFRPKAVTGLQASEFAAGLVPLGERAHGLTVDIWWSPAYPYNSKLTGLTSKALADGFEKATGKQWVMPLGMYHALFEVAFTALAKAKALDASAISEAIRSNAFDTTVGPIDFRKGPYPNTSLTPVVVGQWWKGDKFPLTLLIEDNTLYPHIAVQDKYRPLSY
jgi:branched-chain amino acid transport system substrate-binding protein